MSDPATGAVTHDLSRCTEISAGMHYDNGTGWVPSESMIELAPATGGAQAVRGPHKAYFPPTLAMPIELTMPSGQAFRLQPIGLYYFDAVSGKTAEVAAVDTEVVGILVQPNRVVYAGVLPGLGDLMYVYAVNGFDQSVILAEALPPPEAFGLPSASTRLEVWTAFDGPTPQEQRPIVLSAETELWRRQRMAEPDLVDHLLMFEDCWFPLGAAFVVDASKLGEPGQAAPVFLRDPSDPDNLPVAKRLIQIDNRTVLVESVSFSDLSRKLGGLKQATLPAERRNQPSADSPGRFLRMAASRQINPAKIELASAPYEPSGLLLDYTILSGTANSYTFSNGWTYVISNGFGVGSGTATFQENSTIKYATNAYIYMYGSVRFPASGTPATFTSVDDNAYGATVTNSLSTPFYAAKQAVWIYYTTVTTTVRNARIRWAQRGVQEDQNSGVYKNPSLTSSTFMNCSIGVYLNTANDTLSLSSDTECSLATPIYVQSGSYSGSITTDCGVISVARVNDPSQDTASGDSNKNAQSECSFVVVNTNCVVTAFFDTHLSEWALGRLGYVFTNIASPRSSGWAISTNGGVAFQDNGALPPAAPANPTQGDAGDTVMARDTVNGTIYLLTNPSREGAYQGFRLWRSTDNGQSLALINTNVPGGQTAADKPMIAVNNFTGLSTSTNVYVAGAANFSNNRGVFVSRSSNGGTTWTGTTNFATGHGVDIAIRPDGTVYAFYLVSRDHGGGVFTNWLQYNWLRLGQSNWQGQATVSAHAGRTNLYSLGEFGGTNPKRSNAAAEADYFAAVSFPRVAVSPANGRVYIVYTDLPFEGSTTDRGDIFMQEGIADATGGLAWSGAIQVNNDRTLTDQYIPSVAVNPSGTGLFVGYYSRQGDPSNNSLIWAYGAKANVSGGLVGATFDVFPIGSSAFTNLYCGTTNSTPSSKPWMFDPVWAQTGVWLDRSARVVDPSSTNAVHETTPTYANFTADDYTWSAADGSYYYFVWRDCSDVCTNSWMGTNYIRADPNIRFGRIKP